MTRSWLLPAAAIAILSLVAWLLWAITFDAGYTWYPA